MCIFSSEYLQSILGVDINSIALCSLDYSLLCMTLNPCNNLELLITYCLLYAHKISCIIAISTTVLNYKLFKDFLI